MFRATVLFVCLALGNTHAVYPVIVPAAHSLRTGPLLFPYPLHHGYAGHEILGYGLAPKPLAHHILKRSPHYVAPLSHLASVGHVTSIAPVVAPLPVSHQSRIDVRTTPAVIAAPVLPVVKPLVAPLIPAGPLLHKPLVTAPLHYGVGYYGLLYPHFAHSHY